MPCIESGFAGPADVRADAGAAVRSEEPRTHGWCPTCKEESAIDRNGNCLWCDAPTVELSKRCGGWKRPDLAAKRKVTDIQLQALHRAHMQGQSLNSLAKRTYEKLGCASSGAAATAISRGWKRLGLRARDRVEQVRLTCTVHGKAPKHGPRPGYSAYKRRAGLKPPYRPRCKADRKQAPRRGEPCERSALMDSKYCYSHDPRFELERQAYLAKVRARQPRREMVSMAPFAEWLCRRREELGSVKALARSTGISYTLLCRYVKGLDGEGRPKSTITREGVEAALAADGTATFRELYGEQASLAKAA